MGHTLHRPPVTPFACSIRCVTKPARYGRYNCGPDICRLGQRRSLSCAAASSDVSPGIFPAGKKQAKVRIPALHLNLTTDAILSSDVADSVDSHISAGTTAVIVRDPSASGADLFKAAAKVKEIVRGRIPVLLEDRTDIVSATQVDGVVLTERGMFCSPDARGSMATTASQSCK